MKILVASPSSGVGLPSRCGAQAELVMLTHENNVQRPRLSVDPCVESLASHGGAASLPLQAQTPGAAHPRAFREALLTCDEARALMAARLICTCTEIGSWLNPSSLQRCLNCSHSLAQQKS